MNKLINPTGNRTLTEIWTEPVMSGNLADLKTFEDKWCKHQTGCSSRFPKTVSQRKHRISSARVGECRADREGILGSIKRFRLLAEPRGAFGGKCCTCPLAQTTFGAPARRSNPSFSHTVRGIVLFSFTASMEISGRLSSTDDRSTEDASASLPWRQRTRSLIVPIRTNSVTGIN